MSALMEYYSMEVITLTTSFILLLYSQMESMKYSYNCLLILVVFFCSVRDQPFTFPGVGS
jgi:hypothetical protein